ncbi:MAG: hypothetical protein JNL69_11720 [Bacteroidia bacterium]|nr:hypothetical protein [Bacteroidia bacterium]
MELTTFKKYISKIVTEGNRLQKHNINGELVVKGKFTPTQYISFFIAALCIYFLPTGFSDSFAGYIISFLGIFVGLFVGIVISMFDKSKTLLEGFSDQDQPDKVRARQVRNYLVQFNGITSYAILLAIVIIILLSISLLNSKLQTNIWKFPVISSFKQITLESILRFFKIFAVILQRFFVIYFLLNFFVLTIFSITSYFSYLSSEYKKIKPGND